MGDYEKYVTEVNNVFAIIEKLKSNWSNTDNSSYIEEINEYKNAVIKAAGFLQQQKKQGNNGV